MQLCSNQNPTERWDFYVINNEFEKLENKDNSKNYIILLLLRYEIKAIAVTVFYNFICFI